MMNSSFLHDKEKGSRYSFMGEVQWRGRVVNKQWFGGQRSQQSIPCFDEVSSRDLVRFAGTVRPLAHLLDLDVNLVSSTCAAVNIRAIAFVMCLALMRSRFVY